MGKCGGHCGAHWNRGVREASLQEAGEQEARDERGHRSPGSRLGGYWAMALISQNCLFFSPRPRRGKAARGLLSLAHFAACAALPEVPWRRLMRGPRLCA